MDIANPCLGFGVYYSLQFWRDFVSEFIPSLRVPVMDLLYLNPIDGQIHTGGSYTIGTYLAAIGGSTFKKLLTGMNNYLLYV